MSIMFTVKTLKDLFGDWWLKASVGHSKGREPRAPAAWWENCPAAKRRKTATKRHRSTRKRHRTNIKPHKTTKGTQNYYKETQNSNLKVCPKGDARGKITASLKPQGSSSDGQERELDILGQSAQK